MDSHTNQSTEATEEKKEKSALQDSEKNEKENDLKESIAEKDGLKDDLNDDWFRSSEWKESLDTEDYEEADPTDVKKKSLSASSESQSNENADANSEHVHHQETGSSVKKAESLESKTDQLPKMSQTNHADYSDNVEKIEPKKSLPNITAKTIDPNESSSKDAKTISSSSKNQQEKTPQKQALPRIKNDSQYWLGELGIQWDIGNAEFEGPLAETFSENTSKHWALLVQTLEQKVPSTDDQQKALLFQVLAELYQYQLNDLSKAEFFYKESYECHPLSLSLLVRFSQLLKKKKSFDELLDVFEKTNELNEKQKQLPQHDPKKTKSLSLWLQIEKSYLLAHHFHRIDDAALILQKLLRDYPEESFYPLIKMFAHNQKWDQVFHATKESLLHHEILSDVSVVMRLQLLCQLSLFGVRDVQEIIPYAQRLLQKDTQNSIGLQAITLGYTQKQDYHGLVESLLSLVKGQPHHHEYYFIYRTIGFVSKERLNNYKLAESYLALCFQHSPQDNMVAQNYIETLEYLQNFKDLISVYEQLVAIPASNKDKAIWYRKLGGIIENDSNGQEEQAISYYRQAIELNPDDVLAFSNLGRLYHRTQRWNELYRLYQNEIDLTKDPVQKKSLQMQAAFVAEEYLESPDKAITHYEAVLSSHPDDLLAIKKLVPLYHQKQKFRELIEISQREADKMNDPQKKARIFERIAKTCESELKDFAQAELFYTKVLELIPTANHIFQNLGRLYHFTKQYAKLRDLYLQEAEIEEDADTSLMCFFKAAEISENHLDNFEKAAQIYQQILEQNPTYELAIKAYAKLLHKQKEFAKLALLFSREAEHTSNSIRAGQLYVQAARIYFDQLNDKESSKKFYTLAINAHPYASEFYDEYFRVINLHSDTETKIHELQFLISHAPIPEIKTKLLQKLATLYEGNAQKLNEAIVCYEQILELQNPSKYLIDTVINLCLRLKDFDRLFKFLTQYNNETHISGFDTQAWVSYREQLFAFATVLQRHKNDVFAHLQNAFAEIHPSAKNIFSLGSAVFFESTDFEKISLPALEQFADTLLDTQDQITLFWQMFENTSSRNLAIFALKKLCKLQKIYTSDWFSQALPAALREYRCSHDLIRLQAPNLDHAIDPVEKTYWLFQFAMMVLQENGNIELSKKLLDYIFVYQKNSVLGQTSIEVLQEIQSKNKTF